ncbi:MAG: MFS transporter [SAR202 cluster bacterium]|nr:MFS transporter [SAR202 cluster bacterium]MDP6662553.1 MFS transporter [SAR202 cluster bacterium]MDP6799964.1 MFS transporter [SAR202 cluster bacterium]
MIGLPESDASRQRYRWVMLAGLWLAYASFGLVSGGIPPLVGVVSGDLNLSRSAMGSVLGAWPLIYVAMAIPAGALIDRFGLRRSLAVGVLLIGLSGLLRAVAVNYATMFLAVAVFGLGGPFVSVGAPKLIAVWFPRSGRGTAMGAYMTASNVGRIVALATANSVFMPLYDSSWRLTLVTYAGFAFMAAAVWWVIARDPKQSDSTSGAPDKSFAASLRVFPLLLRGRVVQIVLALSVGSFLFNHGFSNWLPEILRDRGMTPSEAGLWATLPIVVGVGATLVIPHVATPRRRIPMLVVTLLLAGLSALLVGTSSGAPLTLGLLLQGAAGRGVQPIIMLILMDAPQIGADHMGAAGGLYFTAGEVGGVLGPLLLGVAADVTGGFMGGLIILTGLTVALALVAIALGIAVRSVPRETP